MNGIYTTVTAFAPGIHVRRKHILSITASAGFFAGHESQAGYPNHNPDLWPLTCDLHKNLPFQFVLPNKDLRMYTTVCTVSQRLQGKFSCRLFMLYMINQQNQAKRGHKPRNASVTGTTLVKQKRNMIGNISCCICTYACIVTSALFVYRANTRTSDLLSSFSLALSLALMLTKGLHSTCKQGLIFKSTK